MAASNSPTLLSSEKTVAAAGTSETLHTGQRVTQVTIIAEVANTGQVYVGGSDVASTTNDGVDAGDSLEITANGWLDLKDVYIDADTNGEGVDFYAVKA